MNFLKSIFSKKDEPIRSTADFWLWFRRYEKSFARTVKNRGNVEQEFFNKMGPKLKELKDEIYLLAGMFDDNTVELIFTAEGALKNVVFIEELVQAAPKLAGWRFTALKPSMDISNVYIEMNGYKFNKENISFYANEDALYPDEIDLVLTHDELNEENKNIIANGCYIFLDNFLGELNFATSIDMLDVAARKSATKELIPIEKLKDYLVWRQKEFVEKYEGIRYNTEDDQYAGLEARLPDGQPLVATINTDLLQWDRKASHPWILKIRMSYKTGPDNNGMPDERTYNQLNDIEQEIMTRLKDADGYLNIGRQTSAGMREVYFACSEFRRPSKVMHELVGRYFGFQDIGFDLYKDKYWRSFDHFRVTH